MASNQEALHVLLFPFMAPGHILPMLDMARLFAGHGAKPTILTTPANAPLFRQHIDRANGSPGHRNPIQLRLIQFPSGTGLPEGCENLSSVPGHLKPNFFNAMAMLRRPFCRFLSDARPDCVVTGLFMPWTCDVAAELGIPRLAFYGSNTFCRCVTISLERHKTLENLPDEAESLVVPGLPHRIEMLRWQVAGFKKAAPFLVDLFGQIDEAEAKSYGVVVNSFYELEPDYVDHYRSVVGRRAWHIGPMSLCNQDVVDKSSRGNTTTMVYDACLKWLDSKSPGSVVYVCFGSICEFTVAQLRELASGLEASNRPFVWVVREGGGEALPEGYEERVEGRGLVIKGWAPQILILNHAAVGGFLTHCGWNSSLEGISAGLPFVTWPLFAEQFYNERLIVDVLEIGVSVGAKDYTWVPEERSLIGGAAIEEAVSRLMGGGGEAEGRRRRAGELGEMAKKAVAEGGSSYVDMSSLVRELKEMKRQCEKIVA